MKVKLFISTLFFVFVFQSSFAQIPEIISYHGILKNIDGTIANGKYNLTFKIYDSEGTYLDWEENYLNFEIVDGIIDTTLGNQQSFSSANLLFDKQYLLEIIVNGEPLEQKFKLTSVPYSLNTKYLELPYSATYTGSSSAFSIDHSGSAGEVGKFTISNELNNNPAILGKTYGNGHAGDFRTYKTNNDCYTLNVETNGLGGAGHFMINNTNSGEGAVYATTNGTGEAIYAQTFGTGVAGRFIGDVEIAGTLSKSAGSFIIDHPLDPENKVLRHSFIESPEMMNIYKGRAKLENGKLIIKLPDYFDALNHPEGREINLTPVNGWSPLFLEGKIKNNQFVVKTTKDGNPEQEFSWIIYAVRNDEYAKSHPIVVEEEKGVNNGFKKGEFLYSNNNDE